MELREPLEDGPSRAAGKKRIGHHEPSRPIDVEVAGTGPDRDIVEVGAGPFPQVVGNRFGLGPVHDKSASTTTATPVPRS